MTKPDTTSYKVLMDPDTFEYIITETKFHKAFKCRIQKRIISNDELKTWTRAEFIEKLSLYGYESAATIYAESHNMKFLGE